MSEIITLIYQNDFKSALLNFFSDAVGSITSAVRGVFTSGITATKTLTKTLTFNKYRLNGELKGGNAHYRIQSSSKTYSHVVIKSGKVVGATKMQAAFVESCECGQTVYLM